jgi:hypothetical protein
MKVKSLVAALLVCAAPVAFAQEAAPAAAAAVKFPKPRKPGWPA